MLYVANPVVSRRDETDGTLLYNPDADDVALVNGSGLAVWELLSVPRTLTEVAAHLVEMYDGVDLQTATVDATAFLAELIPLYVVEVSEHAPADASRAH
jgi:hypothetical protein